MTENAQDMEKTTDTEKNIIMKNHEKWKADFNGLADVDGFITKGDLEICFQKNNKNPTLKDIDTMMNAVKCANIDGNGKISLGEFLRIREVAEKMAFYNADVKTDLLEAFKVHDDNNDGTISTIALKQILKDYDEEEVHAVVAAADISQDGRLSIEQLVNFLTQMMY